MRWIFSLLLLVVLFSCNEKKPAVVVVRIPAPKPEKRIVFIERAHLNSKVYRVTFKSRFLFPDKLTQDTSFYFQGNFMMLYDKINNSMDTVALSNDAPHPDRLALHDISDSVRTMVFNIHWIENKDIPRDEFVGYNGDSLNIIIPQIADSCIADSTNIN